MESDQYDYTKAGCFVSALALLVAVLFGTLQCLPVLGYPTIQDLRRGVTRFSPNDNAVPTPLQQGSNSQPATSALGGKQASLSFSSAWDRIDIERPIYLGFVVICIGVLMGFRAVIRRFHKRTPAGVVLVAACVTLSCLTVVFACGSLKAFWQTYGIRALEAKAFLRMDLNDHQGAKNLCDEAIQRAPRNPSLFLTRSLAQRGLADVGGAIADLTRAIELNPQLEIAYESRSSLRLELGDRAGAWKDIESALQLAPNSGTLYATRAKILEESGNYDACRDDCARAIALDPTNSYVYWVRSFLEYRQKQWDEAIKDLDRCILLDPKFSHYHFFYQLRGLCKENIRDWTGALADYTCALELKPTELLFHSRAYVWEQLGNKQKSQEDRTRALKLREG